MNTDRYGLPLTTSARAADRYVEALGLLLAARPGGETALAAALEEDPRFALGHAAQAVLHRDAGRPAEARTALARGRMLLGDVTERERGHVEALALFLDGQGQKAVAAVQAHLKRYPRDAYLLELSLVHGFYEGPRGRRRAAVELLDGLAPAYGDDWFFLSRHAFHLQEAHDYRRARPLAERALSAKPENANAAHALAHILHVTGRFGESHAFLAGWLASHGQGGRLHGHLWWHVALLELELGNASSAKAVFDRRLRGHEDESPAHLALADEVGLLWRLELWGDGKVEGWQTAAGLAAELTPGARRPFVDVHAALAFAAAGDRLQAGALRRALEASRDGGDERAQRVSLPALEAAEAFVARRFDAVVERLAPLVQDGWLEAMGGSNVERALVEETLIAAALKAGRFDAARRSLDEWLARGRTARLLTLKGRVLEGMGLGAEADRVRREADDLRS